MYAFYLKDTTKLIVKGFSTNQDELAYQSDKFDKIYTDDFMLWNDFIVNYLKKETIYYDNQIQYMVYTTEVVKYNDDTYAKIDNYDFRLEGVEYIKVAEDDAGYLAFKVAEELKEAKKLKIKECKDTFNSIKMVIKDIETKQILDESINFQQDVFDELIEFNEFPARYFTTISFIPSERIYTDYIPLSKDSLRILYNKTKDYIQYKKTNLFDSVNKNNRERNLKLIFIQSLSSFIYQILLRL